MRTITLSLKEHKGEERIFAEFPYSEKINDGIRQVAGVKWSQTYKQWHLPSKKESVAELQQKINSLARLDTSILKKQLEEKRKWPLTPLPVITQKIMTRLLCPDNQTALDIFIKTLQLKAYSNNTIKTYRTEFCVLLKLLGRHPVNNLREEHIKSYILYFLQKKGYSETQAHTAINAIKFYFEKVLNKPQIVVQIPAGRRIHHLNFWISIVH